MNTTRTGVFMMIYRMNTPYGVLVGRSVSRLKTHTSSLFELVQTRSLTCTHCLVPGNLISEYKKSNLMCYLSIFYVLSA